MKKSILVIQGHPDKSVTHFGHALADAYAEGAKAAGHDIEVIVIANLDFPLLRSQQEFESPCTHDAIIKAQKLIEQADHLVFFYPLWLGGMPALLKAFLEQVMRPDFAFDAKNNSGFGAKKLTGKSANIVVTMGMPAAAYRWYFGAHSLKSLQRNILSFCGIGPIRHSLVGSVESKQDRHRKRWLDKMHKDGRQAR